MTLSIVRTLIARGLSVIPLNPKTFNPVGKWTKKSDRELNGCFTKEKADTVFSDGRDTPFAVFGGWQQNGKCLVIIDIDNGDQPKKEGFAQFHVLTTRLGDLPPTYSVDTPSGGRHLYFWTDVEVRNTGARGLCDSAPHIDLRGEGGIVYGQGSNRVGVEGKCDGRYTVKNDGEVAELPKAWRDFFVAESKCPSPAGGRDDGIIQLGARNNTLFDRGVALARAGADRERVLRALLDLNKKCTPPVAETVVRGIASRTAAYSPTEKLNALREALAAPPSASLPTGTVIAFNHNRPIDNDTRESAEGKDLASDKLPGFYELLDVIKELPDRKDENASLPNWKQALELVVASRVLSPVEREDLQERIRLKYPSKAKKDLRVSTFNAEIAQIRAGWGLTSERKKVINPMRELAKAIYHRQFGERGLWLLEGVWWCYLKGKWRRVSPQWVRKIVSDGYDFYYDAGAREPVGDEDPADYELGKVLHNKKREMEATIDSLMKSVVGLAMTDEEDPLGFLDLPTRSFYNFADCTVEDVGGELVARPHDRKDNLFKICPYVWTPGMQETPEWDRMCQSVFPEREWQEAQHLLECLGGYNMQTEMAFKVFVIFQGLGNSYKSTIARFLTGMMGKGEVLWRPLREIAGDKHGTFSLIHRSTVVEDDVDAKGFIADGILKTLSSQGLLSGNPKGKEIRDFVAKVLVFLLTNYPLRTRDTSGALHKRAIIVPFTPPDERLLDPINGPKRLFAESERVIPRMVNAYKDARQRGEFPIPNFCQKAKKVWAIDSSHILQFFDETITKAPETEFMDRQLLHRVYKEWYAKNYAINKWLGSKEFYIAARAQFDQEITKKVNGAKVRGWPGYRILH